MPRTNAPAISIIIATKGRAALLQTLLTSIQRQSFKDYEILVISPEPIKPHDQKTRFVQQVGAGLPNARNVGLREARGEVVLFLDDDVQLEEEYLLRLNRILSDRPELAGVGGVSTIPERKVTHPLLSPLTRFFTGRSLDSGEKIGRVLENGFTAPNFEYAPAPMEVEWLRGSNMAFRSTAIRATGLFDVNYEGNGLYEDADYGYRAALSGFKLLLDPSLKQRHLSHGTPIFPEVSYAYYMAYNQIYFFYKFRWNGPLRLALCLLGQIFQNLLYLVGGLVYRRPEAHFAHTRGLIDGFRRLKKQRVA